MPKIVASKEILVEEIVVNLLQKRIKNIHLRICSPDGEVIVSAPLRVSLGEIKKFISSKIDWIKAKQIEVKNRKITPPLKFISGEKHFLWGREFELQVVENSDKNAVLLKRNFLEIHAKKSANKLNLIEDFYRSQLLQEVPSLIAEYEKKVGKKISKFGIKKMKTRWGSCNPKERRIWLNLELAKKPIECLEFIVAHEMAHLLQANHSKKFYAVMDDLLPSWRAADAILKPQKLAA
jgi:predicted metal-dependent hydrolase